MTNFNVYNIFYLSIKNFCRKKKSAGVFLCSRKEKIYLIAFHKNNIFVFD